MLRTITHKHDDEKANAKKPVWDLDVPSLAVLINRPVRPAAVVWTAKKQGADLYHLSIPLSSYNKRGDPNESNRFIDIKGEVDLQWSEANSAHYVRGSLALVRASLKSLRKMYQRAWPEVLVVVVGKAAAVVDTKAGNKGTAQWQASRK